MPNITGIFSIAGFAVLLIVALSSAVINQATGQASGSVVQQPLQDSLAGERRVVKMGYSNYAFFFPESGSDTIRLKAGEPVRLEAMLEGPNKLTGCMKSIRTPWGTKVFSQSDTTFDFTPQKEGIIPFSCGMGMGTGVFEVYN